MMTVRALCSLPSLSVTTVKGRFERSTFTDVVGQDLDALHDRLLAEALHEVGAGDLLGEARVVLDVVRDHELAAGDAPAGEALDHERLEVGAGGVDGRSVPGGAGADDDDVADVGAH